MRPGMSNGDSVLGADTRQAWRVGGPGGTPWGASSGPQRDPRATLALMTAL